VSDPKVRELQRVPLFDHCSRDELELLARNTDEVDLPAGRTLIVEGKTSDTFFVLLDGTVEVEVKGRERRRLKQGDVFGEIGMLDRGPATATVTTVTRIRAIVMSNAQFRAVTGSGEHSHQGDRGDGTTTPRRSAGRRLDEPRS